MAFCTEGHESTSTDYCDVCGAPIGMQFGSAAPHSALCPSCGAPSEGRFCENCGHDSALPAPPPAPPVKEVREDSTRTVGGAGDNGSADASVWVATVTADAAHFARMRAQKGPDLDRVDFPDYYPDRRIPLQGPNILIGKRSVSQGVHPDIDLSVAPADIAVSRSHAILHIEGATLTVTDLGSTNGTCLNDSPTPIPPKTPIPLQDGDRIHVGGWTTITLTTEPG
ncbi:FHA domain-containing protein [Nocardia aurantiaca]|uniref:FHA domain-containing protein n=1 Tax=Nocardia aurantiaca TaxID=2675850 RepID=A0A6I3L1Y5_9NOCA|nr:FHA domain-containing protein [Nocardia aurantiaca]MTE15827.1 FHA domain-containing protein [Nocardia aurantiaca]